METPTEEITLERVDHSESLVHVFRRLLESNSLVDCIIAAEGHFLKAHKVILSACSPYFELLFSQESEMNPIVVLADIKFEDLKTVVDFMYHGIVQIPEYRFDSFIRIAECLQLKGLWIDSWKKPEMLIENLLSAEQSVLRNEPALLSEIFLPISERFGDTSNDMVEQETPRPQMEEERENIQVTGDSENDANQLAGSDLSIEVKEETEMKEDIEVQVEIETEEKVNVEVYSILESNKEDETNEFTSDINDQETVNECASIAATSDLSASHERSDNEGSSDSNKMYSNSLQRGISSKKRLNKNVRTRKEKKNTCCDCKKEFTTKQGFKRHLRNSHNGNLPFSCNFCNIAFTEASQLKEHEEIHAGEKPFSFVNCEETFTNSRALGEHSQIRTKGKKRYSCDTCKATFRFPSRLKLHQQIHTGEKPFCCNECEATFSHSVALKKHKLFHSGKIPYKCDICQCAFKRLYTLNIHKRIHSDEKSFNCSFCKAKFKRMDEKKAHEILHNSDKPFVCSTCDATFKQSVHLKIHEQIHEDVAPFVCYICKAAYRRATDLKLHEQVHTSKKPYSCRF